MLFVVILVVFGLVAPFGRAACEIGLNDPKVQCIDCGLGYLTIPNESKKRKAECSLYEEAVIKNKNDTQNKNANQDTAKLARPAEANFVSLRAPIENSNSERDSGPAIADWKEFKSRLDSKENKSIFQASLFKKPEDPSTKKDDSFLSSSTPLGSVDIPSANKVETPPSGDPPTSDDKEKENLGKVDVLPLNSGEEDEEVLLECESKLLQLEEEKKWKDKGLINFQINSLKSDPSSSRIIIRYALGRLIINYAISSRFHVVTNEKQFTGIKFAAAYVERPAEVVIFAVRFKNAETLKKAQDTIQKCVALAGGGSKPALQDGAESKEAPCEDQVEEETTNKSPIPEKFEQT